MPTRFLSDAEVARLESFPEAIEAKDLARYFTLDANDLTFVRRQHSPAGQLGVALQLCSLRWLGFVPDDLPAAPAEAMAALAGVLDAPPRAIFDYSVRPQTRREHRPLVREHAGFRAGGRAELETLSGWLTERALEHDRPLLLLGELVAELRRRRIDRPAVDRLMRLVASARERASQQTFERLASQLSPGLRAVLDSLLVPDREIAGRTRHAWLRSRPTTVSARALRRELDKRAFLVEQVGADRFDLARLPPNRRAWLAQTGRQQTNQALARMAPERRYPVLMAFCVEALERATDDAIEVFDRALGAADRAARRKREELERRGRRDIQTTVRRFIDLSGLVLDAHDSGTDILRLIERRIGIEQLRADRNRAQSIVRPADTGHLDRLIADSGTAARKLLASLIESVELRPAGGDEDELLAALRLIGQLASDQRRWLPGFSPSAFIDAQWRAHVVDVARGRLDRRAYELCAGYELRAALRAGRVWVPGSRRHTMPCLLYAVILAQATNLGLSGMAKASEFSYQQLEWAWEQLCREDTLTAASASLVDFHHALPLAQAWGAGRLSSSDGQRFAARTRGPGVAALPRYFGHRRRGLQIYSWTSDQYSQYASKVVTATVRDATHTLDGILDNQTVLPVEEHTTDTHGYTEMIFGAYDLLGLRFAPRIRNLDRQRLYRHGPLPAVDTAELLKHKIRPELILPYWDELLRLAASLRHGWAPASLLLARLQAGSRRNPLAQALQEYGRLIKTNFLLAWLADDELRQRVGRQLNKGEQLHALRRAVFYANEGTIRQRTPEQQGEQALCLAIVVNAIIAWNTVYIGRVLDELRATGELITTSELEHISPLAHQHIHLYGHYPFDLATRPDGHRPLRTPAVPAVATAVPASQTDAEPRLT